MKHLGTMKLETDRLLLRQFTLDDAQAMYQNWAGDEEVTKYLTWPAHDRAETSKMVLEDWISHYIEHDFYQWAIVLKDESAEPIGSISVVKIEEKIQTAHVGYCIGRNWWNQGITSEAMEEVIRYLIVDIGMNRVVSRHDPNNPNSGKVMVKCGMKYEGTKREADWNNQGLCDCSEYAILSKEYSGKDIRK